MPPTDSNIMYRNMRVEAWARRTGWRGEGGRGREGALLPIHIHVILISFVSFREYLSIKFAKHKTASEWDFECHYRTTGLKRNDLELNSRSRLECKSIITQNNSMRFQPKSAQFIVANELHQLRQYGRAEKTAGKCPFHFYFIFSCIFTVESSARAKSYLSSFIMVFTFTQWEQKAKRPSLTIQWIARRTIILVFFLVLSHRSVMLFALLDGFLGRQ